MTDFPSQVRPRPVRTAAMRAQVGVAVLAAMFAVGCSSSSSPESPNPAVEQESTQTHVDSVAARGVEATIADVPWSKVGPGWTLATWSPAVARRPGEKADPDPAANTSTVLLGPPVNGGGVTEAILFPEEAER